MVTLRKRLRFSSTPCGAAIKIRKWHDTNHHETLCCYVADNDISIDSISDEDFDACAETMSIFGQSDKSIEHYYFWIDKS